ncbi:MAG: hypothetical protein SP1CHLAM54_03160 [Chlamydiia bacterium]|nr:hypothetical protein [Chlamydiia bacterium]MCH9615232.1 hypothetical protein [Chlamydiia bacterium]MCH9628446.1 hypothetical protein [Chlamydiia bacterium]
MVEGISGASPTNFSPNEPQKDHLASAYDVASVAGKAFLSHTTPDGLIQPGQEKEVLGELNKMESWVLSSNVPANSPQIKQLATQLATAIDCLQQGKVAEANMVTPYIHTFWSAVKDFGDFSNGLQKLQGEISQLTNKYDALVKQYGNDPKTLEAKWQTLSASSGVQDLKSQINLDANNLFPGVSVFDNYSTDQGNGFFGRAELDSEYLDGTMSAIVPQIYNALGGITAKTVSLSTAEDSLDELKETSTGQGDGSMGTTLGVLREQTIPSLLTQYLGVPEAEIGKNI